MPRRVLIVSPHFPPVNAPDMQRVRMSLPYFREFGWDPFVLTVRSNGAEAVDPLLAATVPPDVPIARVPSIPRTITRPFGIGNVALRALPFLHHAGSRLIVQHEIDLVYFSTTMFLTMPLGRIWKHQHGTPYVIDMQDPWVTDYYDTHADAAPPPKYALAKRLHVALEPWTMKQVEAVIAVSPAYIDTLRGRYPWLAEAMCTVMPFGVSTLDLDLLDRQPQHNPFFERSPGLRHGVFTGASGDFMAPALRILCRGLRDGLARSPRVFEAVRLHFIGTDYATGTAARMSVEPIAEAFGVQHFVQEQTSRAPYFQALQVVKDADFLLVIGSDDPAYVASKLRPYVFARKPILSIVHEASQMIAPLRDAGAVVVTFGSDPRGHDGAVAELVARWTDLLSGAPGSSDDIPDGLDSYSAREGTRRQCAVFDDVLERRRSARRGPCTN